MERDSIASAPVSRASRVRRGAFEVEGPDGGAIVWMSSEAGNTSYSCSCRRAECEHVDEVVSHLAGRGGRRGQGAAQRASSVASGLPSFAADPNRSESSPRSGRTRAEAAYSREVAEAVRDAISIASRDRDQGQDPGVWRDVLDRLSACSQGTSGFARVVARLGAAVAARDAASVAMLLDGTVEFVERLDGRVTSEDTIHHAVLLSRWLAPRFSFELSTTFLHDVELTEIGRENVETVGGRLARRYFVDVEGALFVEEVRPGEEGSVGGSPRHVRASLAEVDAVSSTLADAHVRRIRLLQYEVRPVTPAQLDALALIGIIESNEMLIERYRLEVSVWGALAEPIVRVCGTYDGVLGGVVDSDGRRARFTPGPESEVLARACDRQGTSLSWVLSRLVLVDGVLMLEPVSLALSHGEGATNVELIRLA